MSQAHAVDLAVVDACVLVAAFNRVDGHVLGEAEELMTTYLGRALGLADTVNAVLAWRLRRSVILSFDHHYADVIAPRTRSEQWLEVVPGPTR